MSEALIATGRQIITITASPIEAVDPEGDTWFIKPDADDQGHQLRFLAGLALPTPEVQYLDADTIATRHAGVGLDLVLRGGDEAAAAEIVRDSGVLLAKTHSAFKAFDSFPSDEMWSRPNPATTAEPATNFVRRFVDQKSLDTNAMGGDLPQSAAAVRDKLLYLVDFVLTSGIPDDLLTQDEMSYGDFKPENILSDSDGALYLIDPVLHKGNRMADLAKFYSRFNLEPNAPEVDTLGHLLDGYRQAEPKEKHRFNEREFQWLAAMDTVNILSGYLGRLARGDTSYRIVQALGSDPRYAARVGGLLDNAMGAVENAHAS